jgi:DnaK suppressor protein
MFVSILQLMGFPIALPVHSRAGETLPDVHSRNASGVTAPHDDAQDKSARRPIVKASSGKDNKAKSSKPVAKVPAKSVASKPAGKATVAKKVVTTLPKPVAKASAKSVNKPVAKSAVKAVAKTAARKPVVAAPKAKVAAKPTPVPAKAAAVPVVKSKSKALAKPVPTPSVKPVPATTALKPKNSMPQIPTPVKVPAPVIAPVAATVPAKAGRPSSRLAQLTVPSMAQAVASTAAKASYTQTTPSPVIVPVLPSAVKKDPKLANNWKTKPVAELSDAELMAMPDSEYMNEVQMAAFRLKLEVLKRDILSNAGETTEHLREDTSVTPDPADRATIEEEHALELRTRDRERKLLKKIEQSIARIDAGDYGYCDETGEPIGVGRLLARPTATLSLEAQQRRELKQKMFGD